MTSTYSKLDTAGQTQPPPDAQRHTSEKRRHADQSPVPHQPHQSAAFDEQHPMVDDAAAAKSRHREHKAMRREAKKARSTRAAPSNMAAAAAAAAAPAAVLVAAPQTAMTASASQAAQQVILDAGSSQPNSSRDNCQAVTALPGSVAAPSQCALKMAEGCKDPADCDAAGTAPAPGCVPSYRLTVQTAACIVASGKCAVMLHKHQLCQWCIYATCTYSVPQCEAVCPRGSNKQRSFPIRQFAVFVKF